MTDRPKRTKHRASAYPRIRAEYPDEELLLCLTTLRVFIVVRDALNGWKIIRTAESPRLERTAKPVTGLDGFQHSFWSDEDDARRYYVETDSAAAAAVLTHPAVR